MVRELSDIGGQAFQGNGKLTAEQGELKSSERKLSTLRWIVIS